MSFGHLADDDVDQRTARGKKLRQGHRLCCHAFEAAQEFIADWLEAWCEHLGHGPIMAEQINDERAAQGVVDAFVGQEIPHVEEIPRMLSIEGGDEFAGEEVGEGDDRYFRETERSFDGRRDSTCLYRVDGSPQDGRDFDLDLNAFGPDEKSRDGTFRLSGVLGNPCAGNRLAHACSNPAHRMIDCCKRFGARVGRQVGQIDIDGETRHVANEEIDRGAALESEAILLGNKGQNPS